MWKLDGNTLINKAYPSTSNYVWSIKTKGGLFYIKNNEKNKVLKVQIGGYNELSNLYAYEIIEEDFVEDKPKQLWIKSKPDGEIEGYFFLGCSEDEKMRVLSATNESALEIRGM